MNLKNNYEDISCDLTLLESTILALSETWLDQNMTLCITGYQAHFNSVGPGKGLALYYKGEIFKPNLEVKHEKFQITKLESNELELILVYKSESAKLSELLEHLQTMINPLGTTVVCGDFNICYHSNKNNKLSKYLENIGFSQLNNEATHIRGRHLDHFYFRTDKDILIPSIYRYSPYFKDHDALCATILISHSSVYIKTARLHD